MEEAFEVLEREAELMAAPMLAMGRDIDAWEERGRLMVQMPDRLLDLPAPALPGVHQFANAGLAVAAILSQNDLRITDEAIARGLETVVWPARFQRLTAGPLGKLAAARGADLWLDGGHNPHAGRALAETCEKMSARDPRPWVLIAAMYARKDAKGFFEPFKALDPTVYTTTFESDGAQSPAALVQGAQAVGLRAETADGVEDALKKALAQSGPAPHVLICGGLHFAGEVLAMSPETWPT
jgi:dihydrofolate synthase/folylpolyglutamate synthase